MEEKVKTFLFWSAIAIFCFVGIPIHLKGSENVLLESTFRNYTTEFNKSYDGVQFKEKLHHFKRSLEHIKMLNERDNQLLSASPGEEEELKLGEASNDVYQSDHKSHHHKSHKKWRPGMPKNQGSAHWGLTKFADISPEDFQTRYLDPKMLDRILTRQGKKDHHKSHNKHRYHSSQDDSEGIEDNKVTRRRRAATVTTLPLKVDWRKKGIVTPVKHQMNCGACWAFSTIETVESMNALQKNTLKSLSVQQVIDCATNGNMGCNGGDTCSALSWMASKKLATESEYPTTLKDGSCRADSAKEGVQIAANFTCQDLEGAEHKILDILAHHGPVVTAVDATNWQFYVGGIIQWNCDSNNNHAVQVVGYDTTATPPHYIVRNSWGPDFGDNGYLYVAIGSNLCGIAREVSSLTVK